MLKHQTSIGVKIYETTHWSCSSGSKDGSCPSCLSPPEATDSCGHWERLWKHGLEITCL